MRKDNYGQIVLTEDDLCNLYMQDPERVIHSCLVENHIDINQELEIANPPNLVEWQQDSIPIQEFDRKKQEEWNMPDEYKGLDIAKWVLDQCKTDIEKQRVGEELMLYLDRDLFPLLQYLKYLVDTMRKYNVVWGVGRGSSVSSYVLYLIGVHKVDSIYYDLDIHEFLR